MKCTYPGCKAETPAAHPACPDHWKLLSEHQRTEIHVRVHGWRSHAAGRLYAESAFKTIIREEKKRAEAGSLPPSLARHLDAEGQR